VAPVNQEGFYFSNRYAVRMLVFFLIGGVGADVVSAPHDSPEPRCQSATWTVLTAPRSSR